MKSDDSVSIYFQLTSRIRKQKRFKKGRKKQKTKKQSRPVAVSGLDVMMRNNKGDGSSAWFESCFF